VAELVYGIINIIHVARLA